MFRLSQISQWYMIIFQQNVCLLSPSLITFTSGTLLNLILNMIAGHINKKSQRHISIYYIHIVQILNIKTYNLIR